ncbi:hypothetical protein PROFUN_04956 [Planoprotostelium fungivorum]|uniref:Uncharacterized protein n=1 Tax=Planoprotostelium fungivorum TaxID=1890364 RepID=A0A2P6NSP2_9EUKA|nr:hypothetical protein PROFUN_04956 [Planoprotostelium fungivorum]
MNSERDILSGMLTEAYGSTENSSTVSTSLRLSPDPLNHTETRHLLCLPGLKHKRQVAAAHPRQHSTHLFDNQRITQKTKKHDMGMDNDMQVTVSPKVTRLKRKAFGMTDLNDNYSSQTRKYPDDIDSIFTRVLDMIHPQKRHISELMSIQLGKLSLSSDRQQKQNNPMQEDFLHIRSSESSSRPTLPTPPIPSTPPPPTIKPTNPRLTEAQRQSSCRALILSPLAGRKREDTIPGASSTTRELRRTRSASFSGITKPLFSELQALQQDGCKALVLYRAPSDILLNTVPEDRMMVMPFMHRLTKDLLTQPQWGPNRDRWGTLPFSGKMYSESIKNYLASLLNVVRPLNNADDN